MAAGCLVLGGEVSPGVPPPIVLGCPLCLLVVGDVGTPSREVGVPFPWRRRAVGVLLPCAEDLLGRVPILPHCLPPTCVPSPQNSSQVLFSLCPPRSGGAGVSSCCFPLPLGGTGLPPSGLCPLRGGWRPSVPLCRGCGMG